MDMDLLLFRMQEDHKSGKVILEDDGSQLNIAYLSLFTVLSPTLLKKEKSGARRAWRHNPRSPLSRSSSSVLVVKMFRACSFQHYNQYDYLIINNGDSPTK
jgi:hypothetical protein